MTHSNQSANSSQSLVDNHDRKITYLRLAITDRCNLRCRYCMPEKGMQFVSHEEILRYEEMLRLVTIFTGLGINKLRITGGEPFARKACVPFLQNLLEINGVQSLYVTTNGIVTAPHLDDLKAMGISGINLSLDTLDPQHFYYLTRKDSLDLVLATMHGCLERNIPLKINSVVVEETTDDMIRALAGLAERHPLTVRFIEKMAFSGNNNQRNGLHGHLYQRLSDLFDLQEIENNQPTTARLFKVPGFTGKVGVIEGHSRKFCATCNKLRITPLGMLKTCLYDNGVADLKKLLRSGAADHTISQAILDAVGKRFIDGLVTEENCERGEEPSMASIGG